MLVELKSGETFNGILINCDSFMNLNLHDVICTSKDGTKFWKMDKVYIRGQQIKYIRVPDETLDEVKETEKRSTRGRGRGRGVKRGAQRGRGRGRGRGERGRGTRGGRGRGE